MATEEQQPLQTAIDGWLADGPLRLDELFDRGRAEGLLPDDEDEAWEDLNGHFDTTDGYWRLDHGSLSETVVLARTFLDTGLILTHRVTEEELAEGVLVEDPDLGLLTSSVGGFSNDIDLVGGGVLSTTYDGPDSSLAGPSGWLDGVAAGDLLAFTRRDLTVEMTVIDELSVGDDTAEIEGLRAAAADWIRDGSGMDTFPLVMDVLARNPQRFHAPCRPVGELLEAVGLEQRGVEWGRAGTPWRTRQEQWAEGGTTFRRHWGFDRCCDDAFDLVLDELHLPAGDRDLRAIAEALGHSDVLPALVDNQSTVVGGHDRLVELAEEIVTELSGRRAAPGSALRGLVVLRRGDAVEALELLERAVAADADLISAREALAALEIDRGDVSRAVSLLQHELASPAVRELVTGLRDRQAALRPSAGRNDPCPCGSGRKFKHCCARGGPLALGDRIPLITQRLNLFSASPANASLRFSLALSAVVGDDITGELRDLVNDPFLNDVLIHEGGIGDGYLEERGRLLASDEGELLGRILEAPRRLWEVLEVEPGHSMTLRDTATGEQVSVIERSGSTQIEPGELVLARAAEVDGTQRLFGLPILVPLSQRSRVLRMIDDELGAGVDADALARWYGHLRAPAELRNREGEVFVSRRTDLALDDPDDVVTEVLDDLFVRDDSGANHNEGGDDDVADGLVWNEFVDIDGDQVIRATLRLRDEELVVTSNSDERQDRVLGVLEQELTFTVLLDTVTSGDELVQTGGDQGSESRADPGPEARRVMEEYLLDYERRWVDEEIPVLDGLTPRQAYDDPTRREDLEALLREFGEPDPDGLPAMSATRIRAILEDGATPGA